MFCTEQLLQYSGLDTYLVVPIGQTIQMFHYNESFAAPPPARGSPEPIWDSLIPSLFDVVLLVMWKSLKLHSDGLGYVKDAPFIGHNFSVISVFHQLHCLVGPPSPFRARYSLDNLVLT